MARNLLGELVWKITGDTTQLNSSVDNSTKKVGTFGKLLQAVGAGFIAKKITDGFISVTKRAIDANETISKFNTVFRAVGKEAESIASNLSKSFGISSVSARELLGDTGDLLTGFGFTASSALKLSNEVNELAVDLASFTNFSGGAAGASQALTKALLGERESVKSLGISILEKDVIEQVAINRAKGLRFETERQAKAQATLDIAIKQSQNAIGDYSRTQDEAANVIRTTQERFADLAVEIGNILLPIITPLLTFVRNSIESFLNWNSVVKDVVVVAGIVTAGLSALALGWVALAAAAAAAGVAINFALLGIPAAIGLITAGITLLVKNWDKVKDAVQEAFLRSEIFVKKFAAEFLRLATVIFTPWLIGTDLLIKAFNKLSGKSIPTLTQGIRSVADEIEKSGETTKKELAEFLDGVEKKKKALEELAKENKKTEKGRQDDSRKSSNEIKKFLGITKKEFDKFAGKFQEFANAFNATYGALNDGLQDFISALEELNQASLEKDLDRLEQRTEAELAAVDARTQAELAAKGLLEETEIQKLQRELEEATLAGDTELAEEKRIELERAIILKSAEEEKARIQKEADKKSAILEYNAALRSHKFKLVSAIAQAPVAIINAMSAGFGAPFPLGVILGPLLGGLAAAAAGVQIAAIQKAKPQRPSFAVGVSNLPSDTIADLHAGEMIVPKTFAESIRRNELSLSGGQSGSQSSSSSGIRTTINMITETGSMLKQWIFEGTQDRTIKIDEGALVAVGI